MSDWHVTEFALTAEQLKEHDPVTLIAEAPPTGGYAVPHGSDLLDWTEWAACAAGETPDLESGTCTTVDPELFFPEQGESGKIPVAKGLCAECPVRQACLDHAMRIEAKLPRMLMFGVWGGMDPDERHALREELHGRLDEDYCPNGHLWDEANIYERPDGSRNCRACQRDAKRRHYEKNRAAKAA